MSQQAVYSLDFSLRNRRLILSVHLWASQGDPDEDKDREMGKNDCCFVCFPQHPAWLELCARVCHSPMTLPWKGGFSLAPGLRVLPSMMAKEQQSSGLRDRMLGFSHLGGPGSRDVGLEPAQGHHPEAPPPKPPTSSRGRFHKVPEQHHQLQSSSQTQGPGGKCHIQSMLLWTVWSSHQACVIQRPSLPFTACLLSG